MPTTFKYNDVETSYELKTYELILTCGKCIPTGQLIATGKPTENNQTLHVCNQCGREQLIAGPVYPRTETRKVATERFIERTEVIPDELPRDYYPDYHKDKAEVSELTGQQLLDLLQTTQEPVMIDHLEHATSAFLLRFIDMRKALFDMARDAASLRVANMQAPANDKPLEFAYDVDIVKAIEVITSTHYPTNITHIQNALEGRLVNLPELRRALYESARYTVSMRSQATKAPDQQVATLPTKNRGGRPRKQTAIA